MPKKIEPMDGSRGVSITFHYLPKAVRALLSFLRARLVGICIGPKIRNALKLAKMILNRT